MKKRLFLLSIMCVLTFVMTSCKKEDNENELMAVNPTTEHVEEELPSIHDKSRMAVGSASNLEEKLRNDNNVATYIISDEQFVTTNIDKQGEPETLTYYVDGDEYVIRIQGQKEWRGTIPVGMIIDDYVIEIPSLGGTVFIITLQDGDNAVSEILYYVEGEFVSSLSEEKAGSIANGSLRINEERAQIYFAGGKLTFEEGIKHRYREVSDMFLAMFGYRYNVDDEENGHKYIEVFEPVINDEDSRIRAQYRDAFKEYYDLISDQRFVYFIDIDDNGTYECIVEGLFDTKGGIFYMENDEIKRYVSRYPNNSIYVYQNRPMFVDGVKLDESNGLDPGESYLDCVYNYLTEDGIQEYGRVEGSAERFDIRRYYIDGKEVSVSEFLYDKDPNSQGGASLVGDYDYDYAPVYSRLDVFGEEYGEVIARNLNEYGEPVELGALRERVANEYESDFGTYTLSVSEDLKTMYEWHMAGSYEGGIYYRVTDSGFEKLKEWEYDSMEDKYTIDGIPATADDIMALEVEMQANLYSLN